MKIRSLIAMHIGVAAVIFCGCGGTEDPTVPTVPTDTTTTTTTTDTTTSDTTSTTTNTDGTSGGTGDDCKRDGYGFCIEPTKLTPGTYQLILYQAVVTDDALENYGLGYLDWVPALAGNPDIYVKVTVGDQEFNSTEVDNSTYWTGYEEIASKISSEDLETNTVVAIMDKNPEIGGGNADVPLATCAFYFDGYNIYANNEVRLNCGGTEEDPHGVVRFFLKLVSLDNDYS